MKSVVGKRKMTEEHKPATCSWKDEILILKWTSYLRNMVRFLDIQPTTLLCDVISLWVKDSWHYMSWRFKGL